MLHINNHMCFRRLLVLCYFVLGGFVVVHPLVSIIPYVRTRPAASITWQRQLQLTMRLQKNPSLLRMSKTLPIQDDISRMATTGVTTRRNWIDTIKTGVLLVTTEQLLLHSQVASAKPDCYTDCYKNCIALAPKDNVYCSESCTDYCLQDDRQDGLSGSVSSEKGEVGILGGSFGTGTVVKGQDKPPVLGKIPGLDFTSESGKKMIGY